MAGFLISAEYSHPAEPALKKQSRWSDKPWKPGEIPTKQGTLRTINGPERKTPYGEFMGVECPVSRGEGWADGKRK